MLNQIPSCPKTHRETYVKEINARCDVQHLLWLPDELLALFREKRAVAPIPYKIDNRTIVLLSSNRKTLIAAFDTRCGGLTAIGKSADDIWEKYGLRVNYGDLSSVMLGHEFKTPGDFILDMVDAYIQLYSECLWSHEMFAAMYSVAPEMECANELKCTNMMINYLSCEEVA